MACQWMRVDAGGYELEVESTGSGGRAFVCVHGLVDTRGIWNELAPWLERYGRVVRFDQRAHGASGAPPGPYRREDLAADVVAILDRLEIERGILIGHSLGGIVALTAALAHPDRVAGLVLLGTASECSEKVAGWYERIACAAERDGLEGIRRAIYGQEARRPIVGDPQGLAHVTRTLKSLHSDPLTPKLASVRVPTLLLVGERDPMGTGASVIIQRQIPGAQLMVLAERGHWLHREDPEAIHAAMCEQGMLGA